MEVKLLILFGGLIFIIALGCLWRYFSQSSNWQSKQLSFAMKKLESGQHFSEDKKNKLLRQIYLLISKELTKEEPKILYKTLDLLKLAFGHGLGRKEDPARLTKIIFQAIEANKPDVSGHSIHAFNPFVRKAPPEYILLAVEQLGVIAAASIKRHKNFLAARAIEIIFEALERLGRILSKQSGQPVLLEVEKISTSNAQEDSLSSFQYIEVPAKAIKLAGLAVLRSRDIDLFRELCVKINEFILETNKDKDQNKIFETIWPEIFAAWLNYLGRKENNEAFTLLLTHLNLFVENGKFDEKSLQALIGECRHIIGVSSVNPDNKFALPLLSFMLTNSYSLKDIKSWRQVVSNIREVSQIACLRYGIEKSFMNIYPLLEAGRRTMLDKLRNDGNEVDAIFTQEALEATVKGCLQIARYEARKDFLLSVADVVIKLKDCWLEYPIAEGSPKYISKFCHLLIIYWAKGKSKEDVSASCQSLKVFLTEDEINKLKFLF